MNEIFLPGKKVLTVRDISSFAVRPENENALIEVKTRPAKSICIGLAIPLLVYILM